MEFPTLFCTTLMAAGVAVFALPPVLPAQGGFAGPGSYEISNLQSGKVLDLDRNDQSTVIQFSSRGTDNQTWVISQAGSGYYYIRNGMNGYALDASSNNNSAPVRGVPYNGSPSQQWRIDRGKDGNALIVNQYGKSLDIPDGTNRDGVRVQIYDLNGDSNQRFVLRRVSGNFGRGWMDSRGPVPGGPAGGPGYGNPGYGNTGGANRLTCSSDSGSRVYCNADTSGSVRMSRQISGSPCTEGSTWGYDNRGIWVDRGCRAEFEITPGGGFRGGPRGPSRGGPIVTCNSNSGGRVICEADTSRGVRLVRQLSGSPCTEGSTWGFNEKGIWVSRGCRAEFQLGR
jgi:hypothetical protein